MVPKLCAKSDIPRHLRDRRDCIGDVVLLPAAIEIDPRRPSAIEAIGVPAIPPELAARLEHYDHIRVAHFCGWSPDGRGILIRTPFGSTEQLHRVYEPGGRREQVSFFDEPVEGRFVTSGEDGAMLATLSVGGDENGQIYSIIPSKHASTLLTDGKSRNLLGPTQLDGSKFAFGTNRRNGRDTDWFAADCRKPSEPELLMETDGEVWFANSWSPDGKQLLMVRFRSATESYPAVLDVATKKLTPLPSPQDVAKASDSPPGPNSYRFLKYAADGKSIYLATDVRGEFAELAQLDLQSGQYTWHSSDIPWDISDIELDKNSSAIAFSVNKNGQSAVYLLKDGTRSELKIPLGTIANLDFSPDGKQLGFTLAAQICPPTPTHWNLPPAN